MNAVDATRDSWPAVSQQLLAAAAASKAVSVDAEFSGVSSNRGVVRWLHGPAERYAEAAAAADKYCVLQVGLSFLQLDDATGALEPGPTFRVWLRPDDDDDGRGGPFDEPPCDVTFSFSSFAFLAGQGFNYGFWARNSIQHSQAADTLRSVFASLPLVGFGLSTDLLFLERWLGRGGPLPAGVDAFVRRLRGEGGLRPPLVVDCRLLNGHRSHTPSLKKLHAEAVANSAAAAAAAGDGDDGDGEGEGEAGAPAAEGWHDSAYDARATAEVFLWQMRMLVGGGGGGGRAAGAAAAAAGGVAAAAAGAAAEVFRGGVEVALRRHVPHVVDKVPWHWAPPEVALDLRATQQRCPYLEGLFKGEGVLVGAPCLADARVVRRKLSAARMREIRRGDYLFSCDKESAADRFFDSAAFIAFKKGGGGGGAGAGEGEGAARDGPVSLSELVRGGVLVDTFSQELSEAGAAARMLLCTVEEYLFLREGGWDGERRWWWQVEAEKEAAAAAADAACWYAAEEEEEEEEDEGEVAVGGGGGGNEEGGESEDEGEYVPTAKRRRVS